jgi:hypothetical protein
VTGVSRSGGPAAGTNTAYAYDPASNRTNVTVTNSPNGTSSNGSGNGTTAATTKYVIVPLNAVHAHPVHTANEIYSHTFEKDIIILMKEFYVEYK